MLKKLTAVAAVAAALGLGALSLPAAQAVGNWPDPYSVQAVGNWPDPYSVQAADAPSTASMNVGNWPDPY